MKSLIMYTLSEEWKFAGDIWQIEYNDSFRLHYYLEERGVTFETREDNFFTILYASPSHRTATELMMSGCPTKCKIRIKELVI